MSVTFTDPGLDLQRAIVAALKAAAAVAAIVGAGVYDQVPRSDNGDPNVPFPFVTYGETQTMPELGEYTDAAETIATLHLWSRAVGYGELKALALAVIAALHDASLVLDSGAIQSLLLQDSRSLRDPDGITSHGILTFQILTDAN